MRHKRTYRITEASQCVTLMVLFMLPIRVCTKGGDATSRVRNVPFLKFLIDSNCCVVHLAIQAEKGKKKVILRCPKLNCSQPENGKKNQGVNQLAERGQKPVKNCSIPECMLKL